MAELSIWHMGAEYTLAVYTYIKTELESDVLLNFTTYIFHFRPYKHQNQGKHLSSWHKHQFLSDYGITTSQHTRGLHENNTKSLAFRRRYALKRHVQSNCNAKQHICMNDGNESARV